MSQNSIYRFLNLIFFFQLKSTKTDIIILGTYTNFLAKPIQKSQGIELTEEEVSYFKALVGKLNGDIYDIEREVNAPNSKAMNFITLTKRINQ